METSMTPPEIVGTSPRMRSLMELARRAGLSQAPVLVTGETGTGKELIARLIHTTGTSGPFIPIDCCSIPGSLLESELFGHAVGAYTGAGSGRPGLFELCQNGTAFLDEIAELPLELQAKLLRVLENGQVRRIGSGTWRKLNFRVIVATNRDLLLEAAQGSFRPDLYYRINVIRLSVPPLRERKEDIPDLVAHFLNGWGGTFRQEAMEAMISYDWPGNVRELKNCIERLVAISFCREIGATEVLVNCPELLCDHRRVARQTAVPTLAEAEKEAILGALSRTGGHRVKAAELLSIGRTTLYRKLRGYAEGPCADVK